MTDVNSRIDGEFEGFDEDKVFRLQNGQVWKQARYKYKYHYAYMPKVHIYRGSDGLHKMKVDGVADEVVVEQVS